MDFEDSPVIKVEPEIDDYDDVDSNSIGDAMFGGEAILNPASNDIMAVDSSNTMPDLLEPLGSHYLSDMPELIPMSLQPVESKGFQCEFCSKIFKRKSHLTRHRLLHTGEKPYACTLCDERFTRSENRTRHIAQVHQQNSRYSCPICGKGFSQLQRQQIHMQIHFQERLIFCPICGNSYTNNSCLTNHMKIHESPASLNGADTRTLHECSDCGKKFTRKDHMQRHKNSHSGIRPFQCDICLKSFSRKDNLVKHRANCVSKRVSKSSEQADDESDPLHIRSATYKPLLNTEQPESDFSQPEEFNETESILPNDEPEANKFPITVPNSKDGAVEIFLVKKKHKPSVTHMNGASRRRKRSSILPELTTEEELTLSCNLCNKKLSKRSYLQRHKLSHLLVRPYQCDLCPKSFTRNTHLKRHKLIHNPISNRIPGIKLADAIGTNAVDARVKFKGNEIKNGATKPASIGIFFNERSLNDSSMNEDSLDSLNPTLPNEYKGVGDENTGDLPDDYYGDDDNYLNSFLEVSMTTTNLNTREQISIKDDSDDSSKALIKNRLRKPAVPKKEPQSETPNGTNKYKCNKCNKSYPKPYLLARHASIHTGEKRYKCEICDRGFTRLEHKKRHMAIHSQQRKYECDICLKKFSRADHVLAHTKTYHIDVKPYKCTFSCGERFDTLKEKLAHTQLRNCVYWCLVCRVNFKAKEQLLYHNLVAHSNGECSLIPNTSKDTDRIESQKNENVHDIFVDNIKIEYEDPLSMD